MGSLGGLRDLRNDCGRHWVDELGGREGGRVVVVVLIGYYLCVVVGGVGRLCIQMIIGSLAI